MTWVIFCWNKAKVWKNRATRCKTIRAEWTSTALNRATWWCSVNRVLIWHFAAIALQLSFCWNTIIFLDISLWPLWFNTLPVPVTTSLTKISLGLVIWLYTSGGGGTSTIVSAQRGAPQGSVCAHLTSRPRHLVVLRVIAISASINTPIDTHLSSQHRTLIPSLFGGMKWNCANTITAANK